MPGALKRERASPSASPSDVSVISSSSKPSSGVTPPKRARQHQTRSATGKGPRAKNSDSALASALQYDPTTYKATKNEVGVFTTPGYSEDVKGLWKFKNAEEARRSAEAIWARFAGYREQGDFVGMDICRKFIQMGRTRSLRYALRPSGRKYDASGAEQRRTGKVYDQGKLDGAEVYEGWLGRCWDDEVYKQAWEEWRRQGGLSKGKGHGRVNKEEEGAKENPGSSLDGEHGSSLKREKEASKRGRDGGEGSAAAGVKAESRASTSSRREGVNTEEAEWTSKIPKGKGRVKKEPVQ